MTVLLTGVAGFIGYHVAEALLARGDRVIGVDNLNAYYDVRLKQARLARLDDRPGFEFHRADVADREAIHGLVNENRDIETIVHLAAQAGVRHSLVDPYAYVQSNVMGHLVVLEAARLLPRLRHVVYASSSSVYGANRDLPFREADRVDTPVSIYAATKRADELMSHAYAHLHGLPQTGLRFFTVYGPWGRPDMAYYGFARAIVAGEPITLYDGGALRRDFTYIDDIVAGVVGLPGPPAGGDAAGPGAEYRQPPQRAGEHAGRLAGAGAGTAGDCARGAAAAGRRGGDVRLDRRHRRADRFRAADVAGGGDSAVRGLVQGVARDRRINRADRHLTAGAGGPTSRSRRTGGLRFASCLPGAAELDFLFCAAFGAHLSKSSVGPVLAGPWVFSLRSLTVA